MAVDRLVWGRRGGQLSPWDSERWGSGTSYNTLMTRWVLFFFNFFGQYYQPFAKPSQVCAISQCQHLSVRQIQLRLRQLWRGRVTGVSLILPIAFLPFVFAVQVMASSAICTGKLGKLLMPWAAVCRQKTSEVHLFEIMSTYFTCFLL